MSISFYDYADQYRLSVPTPEFRQDPIVGRWVIIASERANRPISSGRFEPTADAGGYCPFCAGSESETPQAVLSFDGGTETTWQVRVVPNKYPALQISGDPRSSGDSFYGWMAGQGLHEVIIECSNHERSLTGLSDENVKRVIDAYRERLLTLKQDSRFVYGMVFKNVGTAAGASLEHSHSQLIALPIVPITVQEEMTGAHAFYEKHGRCIYCDLIQHEGKQNRIILETEDFVCFCPYASRFPFETWILPRRHASHFEEIPENMSGDLGGALKSVLSRLETVLDRPSYNYVIHSAPFNTGPTPRYHWHIEVIPRLAKVAGFEWGTGFYINPVPPEAAAAILRECQPEDNRSQTA